MDLGCYGVRVYCARVLGVSGGVRVLGFKECWGLGCQGSEPKI